jgi:hypothetical protein
LHFTPSSDDEPLACQIIGQALGSTGVAGHHRRDSVIAHRTGRQRFHQPTAGLTITPIESRLARTDSG